MTEREEVDSNRQIVVRSTEYVYGMAERLERDQMAESDSAKMALPVMRNGMSERGEG